MGVVTVERMYSYLQLATKVESQLNMLQKAQSKLNTQINKIERRSCYKESECLENELTYNQSNFRDYFKNNYEGSLLYCMFHFNLSGIIGWFLTITPLIYGFLGVLKFVFVTLPYNPKFSPILACVLSVAWVIAHLSILSFLHYIIQRSSLKSEFERNKFEHNRLTEKNAKMQAENEAMLEVYNANLSAVNNEIKQVTSLRNKLYSEDLLPVSYRNLVAVSTMQQWLKYGICTKVYGHGGLMDRYDYEIKIGVIVSNLQQINKKLDLVIKNQQLLYNEIQRSNEISERIFSEVQGIAATQTQMASDISSIKTSASISAAANTRTAMFAEYEHYSKHY